MQQAYNITTENTTTTLQPFYGTFSGTTRVSNFWTLWSKGTLTEADKGSTQQASGWAPLHPD